MPQPVAEIPAFNRFLYASASFGGNVLSRATGLWLVFFYSPPEDEKDLPTLVPRFTLAAILLAVGIQDAIDDPIIGYWSDRTRSRLGRRIPFVLLATPFYVLFFFLYFTPPGAEHSVFVNALYITVILLAQRLMGTLSGGPLEALLPEIAHSSAARVSIVAWQVVLGAVGAVVGLVATGFIKDALGFQVMAAVVAIIALVSRYIGLAGAWRYARTDVEPVRFGVIQSLRQAFRNDQFLYFLPTFVAFNLATTTLLAALPFFADSVILGDKESLTVSLFGRSFELEEGGVSSVLAGAAIIAVIIAIPIVYRLALRRGKAWVYSAAMITASLTFPPLFFMGLIPGLHPLLQSALFAALAGVAMAGVFAFPNAIMADVIDYDALRTGMRREALYYGAQNTAEKWVGSLSTGILAAVFLLGETADNPLGIRLIGPVAGVIAFLGFIYFRGYSLPDEVSAETVALEGGRLKVKG